jgi:hypothetical protein
MDNDHIARVSYFERQFLRTQDFVDEQAYHIAMRRRHNIAHHRWGIVEGLKIVNREGKLFVEPGMAIDGYGREVALPESLPIPSDAFIDKGSSKLDVWLLYNRVGSDPAPSSFRICDENGDAPNYRWQETAQILLTVPDPDFPDPRKPKSVPPGDLNFSPSGAPPDDPQYDWPVFLGRVTKSPKNEFTVEHDNRPYVGLVGESIIAPSKEVLIKLGAEDPERRFAVFISPNQIADDTPQFAINNDGQIEIRGDTTLHGDLTLAGGALEFKVGEARSDVNSPWRIYRAKPDATEQLEQLRIEIDAAAAGENQFAVGHWSEDDKKFMECLTVDKNCTVTVHGNLVVEGRLSGNVERGEAKLTTLAPGEEAKRFLIAAGLTGIGGVPGLLPLLTPNRPSPQNILALAALTPAVFATVRESLKLDGEQYKTFLEALVEDEETAKMIRELLDKKK